MNIPLSMNTYFDNVIGGQKLKVWFNGDTKVVRAPINPYMYSKVRPIYPCIIDKTKKKLLSNPYQEVDLFKCSFNSSGDVARYSNDETCFENHILFTNRVMIDSPEWTTNFANIDELKIMSFDCEMENDGRTFPIPSRNAIAGIGYKCIEGIKNAGQGDIDSEDILTIWSDKRGYDYDIINNFLGVIRDFDPDILVGYNSNNFDLKYIRDRCNIDGIDFNRYISRMYRMGVYNPKDAVEFIDKTNIASSRKYTEVRIQGRISYDIFYPVIRDQSMFGIKSRDMKSVAEWYKIKNIIKENMSNVNSFLETESGRKKIDKYLRSDINITDKLFNIYIKNTLMLAEKLMMPLDDVVNSSPSLISNIIFGRELNLKNIVSDGSVIDRYNNDHVKNKRGGWVETYKKGFIEKLKKLDFKSYYPFISVQFNISPETCFIVKYEEYQGEMGYKFWWANEDEIRWFYASIPDSTFGRNIVIKIDMSQQGFLPVYMRSLFNERTLLKKRMKEIEKEVGKNKASEDVEYAGLKSRENAIKIILNSFTGYLGNKYALYGNLACYVCITGFGRYFTQKVIDKYKSIVVSSDTDAIYTDKIIDDEEANKFIEYVVIKELGFDKCWIAMENEGNYGSAFFLDTKGKNYYIRDLDKDIVIKHGVATKRSSMAIIIDVASDKILMELLKHGADKNNEDLLGVIDSMYDISKWNIGCIKQGVHTRLPSEYKKGTPIGLTISRLAQKRWNIPDNDLIGMQVNYIKLRGKGKYAVVDDRDRLENFDWDKDYYIDMLNNLLDSLGLSSFRPSNRALINTVQKNIEDAWG